MYKAKQNKTSYSDQYSDKNTNLSSFYYYGIYSYSLILNFAGYLKYLFCMFLSLQYGQA